MSSDSKLWPMGGATGVRSASGYSLDGCHTVNRILELAQLSTQDKPLSPARLLASPCPADRRNPDASIASRSRTRAACADRPGRVRRGRAPAGRARPGQAARREPSSVREALIALEVEELGRGAHRLRRVRARPLAPRERAGGPTEWGPLELIRARRVIEGETAAIAAQMGKRKDVDAMTRAIEVMRELADRTVMPLGGRPAPSTSRSSAPAATRC